MATTDSGKEQQATQSVDAGAPWQPMETAPRDGSPFDVLCESKIGVEVVVPNLHYAFKPMGRGEEMILWGKHNFLSPYLTPRSWRPKQQA